MQERQWWKEGCVYQIYPRSFFDSNGDGIGDLRGITEHLEYVKELGCDIIWLNPCYKSPNDDNGYDISDYRAIMDDFGTMEDFDRLLEKAHGLGIRIIMDLVVNHTSDEHEWFIESSSSRDNDRADWYIWRDEKNNWGACFGGSAWEWNEKRGQYYLHSFSKKQPDLNWENVRVREAVYDLMRYWGDKGIDGFRMDVITMISKDQRFPDGVMNGEYGDASPYTNNGPRIHEFLKEMNREAISRYDWLTVGEGAGARVEDTLSYTAPENRELNMIFSFEHMNYAKPACENNWDETPFTLPGYKQIYKKWQEGLDGRGWNTLYLENHDQVRSVSRYGNTSTEELWKRSAKALAVMYFLMQGTPYIYMGQELGMTNTLFADISEYRDIAARNDWNVMLSRGKSREDALRLLHATSRDNSRTPFCWNGGKNGGFSEAEPWIRMNQDYERINVEAEKNDPDSILNFYKKLIALRRSSDTLIYGSFRLLMEEDEDLFVYERTLDGEKYTVAVNMSENEREFSHAGRTVLSNYDDDSATSLRSWEAKVLKEDNMDFLTFGEILFDVFPDKATLGGAPLNVAGHMTRLGLNGAILSAVGSDELGERTLKEISELGLTTEYISKLGYETGKALITLKGKNADYEFNDPCAWDNIPLVNLPGKVSLIYYGTLAQRNGTSAATLREVLKRVSSDHRFFDVNIRKHFYSDEIIREGIENATILKLNDEEEDIVLDALGIKTRGYRGLEELYRTYSLDLILLTKGKEGTMCYKDRWYRVPCAPVPVVDTVGAGDSLSAGFLATYIKTGNLEKALIIGSHIADYVVTQRGAIPVYDEELTNYLKNTGIL